MITIDNVTKTFPAKTGDVTALKDVSLTIQEGEIFGIIGYSGAGKSTLIRLLNGLEVPTSGKVIVDGQEISKIKGAILRKTRQQIGMVFQHFNLLWSRTVKENIAFPLEIAKIPKQKREKRVQELIQLVGLEGKEEAYPSQLSGGQKQRVGIARALANNPKVLLCDEATSALDPKTTDSILELLKSINQKFGITIVLITHEMHVIRKICHRVAVMEYGSVVEVGSVQEVFKHPKAEVTKRFIQQEEAVFGSDKHLDLFLPLRDKEVLVKFKFGDSVQQPIISQLVRQFAIDVNIVQGNVSRTQEGSHGWLVVSMYGEKEDIDFALAFVKKEGVIVEVLANGREMAS
jgi:D-methionine transport system ATP-binding protein